MADEYIRLDTTIMGLDGLINEAPTGSQARALFCAKDMIYDQQRYVSEMKPVKHGYWIKQPEKFQIHEDVINSNYLYSCSCCNASDLHSERANNDGEVKFCWRCGARMDAEPDEPWQSE